VVDNSRRTSPQLCYPVHPTIRVNDTTQFIRRVKNRAFDSIQTSLAGQVGWTPSFSSELISAGRQAATQATGSLCDTSRAQQRPAEMRRFACWKCTDSPRDRRACARGHSDRPRQSACMSVGVLLRSAGHHLASPCQCRGTSGFRYLLPCLAQNCSVDALSRSSCPFIRGKICGGFRAGVSRCDCLVETLLHASGNIYFLRQGSMKSPVGNQHGTALSGRTLLTYSAACCNHLFRGQINAAHTHFASLTCRFTGSSNNLRLSVTLAYIHQLAAISSSFRNESSR
jgi:hypothetical protein